eukprot:SAG11_NODE_16156_length_555_cov_2.026316_1_plen_48_part_01
MAASDVIVVAFVTAEKDPLSITAPPPAELSHAQQDKRIEVSGVTHHYQ